MNRPTKRICLIPEVEQAHKDFTTDKIDTEEYYEVLNKYLYRRTWIDVYEDATVDEFLDLIRGFDYTYRYSDDSRVYNRWSHRYDEIRKVAYSLGEEGDKLWEQFNARVAG